MNVARETLADTAPAENTAIAEAALRDTVMQFVVVSRQKRISLKPSVENARFFMSTFDVGSVVVGLSVVAFVQNALPQLNVVPAVDIRIIVQPPLALAMSQ
jgi:hypothetical protein